MMDGPGFRVEGLLQRAVGSNERERGKERGGMGRGGERWDGMRGRRKEFKRPRNLCGDVFGVVMARAFKMK